MGAGGGEENLGKAYDVKYLMIYLLMFLRFYCFHKIQEYTVKENN